MRRLRKFRRLTSATRRIAADLIARALVSNGFRPQHHTTFPIADGTYGDHEGPALSLLILGDSIAASLGTSTVDETLGAQCAATLSHATSRPVHLRVLARPGTTTGFMKHQLRKALRHPHPPGIALIIVGGNDIVAGTPLRLAAKNLAHHVTQLRQAGWHVLVGTCWDVGHVPAVRHWLRTPLSRRSRRLEHLQTTAVRRAGAVAIPLRDPRHSTQPELFAADRIHPSAHGNALHLQALTGALTGALTPGPARLGG
ncbi:SGNH/GDSL hydrolase family protein [Streptomyces lateritius]|uniref:SGNH/GDSL hydrolase family protein n=1 Tax=Streptomyces lateritius TaxID=67313 RepID=UPI001C8B4A3E|nr:SGNH/GDSL hydrolase family protein [Streptomyces lateritius]MBX9420861.1 SGNH/GDSL hydrolase family protein [Streptomyces lateritius]